MIRLELTQEKLMVENFPHNPVSSTEVRKEFTNFRKTPTVAVVVPTYNEADNLALLAERIFQLKIPNTKLIVVDDGSPDGTGELANKLNRQFKHNIAVIQRGQKLGLGTAYVAGFSLALSEEADYVVQMDADLSHSPEYIPDLLRRLNEADIVIGSRYISGGSVDKTWNVMRKLLSFVGNLGIRLITGLNVKDATSGFKAFHGSVLRSLNLNQFRCEGFGFQTEVTHACQTNGFRIVEHPIVFGSRFRGNSKLSLAIILEAFWHLSHLRINSIK